MVNEIISGLMIGGLLWSTLLLVVALYVYTSLAFYTIGKKLKHERPWLAWIPFANISMILELGGFHWAWVFLILVPILGWIPLGVLCIISMWRIFEKRNYPGWLCLIQLLSPIPFLGWIASIAIMIIWGLVAWMDR